MATRFKPAPDDPLCRCDNCTWTGPTSKLGCQLEDVPDLSIRLDPGGEVPAGECPECGCLAYEVGQ